MSKIWKKLLAVALTASISAGAAVAGTVAYLQDEDSDVNVMTLGNVKIDQIEQERDANGDLVPFKQSKPVYPAVYEGTSIPWADATAWPVANDSAWKVVASNPNVVDKFITVKNTGKSDAYVRTIIAFEVGKDAVNDPYMHLVHNTSDWSFEWAKDTSGGDLYITVGDSYYVVGIYTHTAVLEPNTSTIPNVKQIYLDKTATNEVCEAYGDTFEILAVSQAVQAAGFTSAEEALNEAFGEITAANHPWKNVTVADEIGITEGGTYDLTGDVYTADTGYFHTQEVTAPVTINGNGATVNGIATSIDAFQWDGYIPAMSPIFSSADGSKVTVNDLTFTGTMSAISLGHYQDANYNKYNTELNNVDVIDAEVVSFSAGISPAVCVYGTAVLNNCNIYGTTLSSLDTDPMWPVYDLAAVNYTDVTLKNTKVGSVYIWNQAKLTVDAGSEVDTIIVRGNMNTTKYGLTVKAGASVGAIDLSAITNKAKINITIEDGATVGKIVANGVEYASIADWQNP